MRALLAVCVLLLSACATIPSDAPPYQRAADPPAGYSNLYIYRLNAYPTLRSPIVRIDGAVITSPPERSYTVLPLPPGPHEFVIDWTWDTGWPDLNFAHELKEGQPLYLRISGSFEPSAGGYVAGSYVHVVEQAVAEAELAKCCRYISPRNSD